MDVEVVTGGFASTRELTLALPRFAEPPTCTTLDRVVDAAVDVTVRALAGRTSAGVGAAVLVGSAAARVVFTR